MAEVSVKIAGQDYKLACADGEEGELAAYAKKMDGIASSIQEGMSRPVSEELLLVMIGMTLADELAIAESNAAESKTGNGKVGKELAERITAIADRIEQLSEKFV